MTEFVATATSFPAVVWTVLVLISLGFWAISGLLDLDLDLDLDVGGDVGGGGGDVDVDPTSTSTSTSTSVLSTLGLSRAPLAVVATVISLVGWLVTMLIVLTVASAGSWLLGPLVLLASLVVALAAAGQVARLLAPVYDPNRGTSHAELVGRICTVRTGRVDAGFGQAEVLDASGASHLIQVRCPTRNELTRGSTALVVDVDDGVFHIDPDTTGLT